ncbi:MAG: beta-ketoacyl-ACP synthase II [Gammaproteobacteria bacterium]|nr:beta-ketoacyl-ACP synthase II [Gammaproteobacteria bacterium]NNF67061.1 beta-ketoacyl-ACP synthase II [Gammaproteobacteria bacterium]
MTGRRVVITGLGIVSPVGSTVPSAWKNIVEGKSGIRPIERFDASGFATTFAGEVSGFETGDYLNPKVARQTDAFVHYGVAAAQQAIEESGLEKLDPKRVGVAIGAGIGGIETIEKNYRAYLKSGSPRKISPFFIPGSIINMASGQVSIRHGFRGPNIATVTACTTATHNIGLAARLIANGDADAMVAGGAEMATTPLGVGGFCSARALSSRNDEPEKASRPFDADRDGFVLADGAGVVVLEEYEQARKRGATLYAELIGFGMSADAHHITAPLEDGSGAALCMENALADASIQKSDVNYINAHGTSTPLGDKAESAAVRLVFGDHANTLAVSSTKSMTGHLLGAAGGVEAIFSILAIRDGIIPPTINYETPDPGCDLDYVPNTAREQSVNVVLSNSFGFGGTNGTLIFGAIS